MNPRARRQVIAFGTSVLIHVGLVVATLGFGAWQGFRAAPAIEFEIAKTTELPKELPLGPPPAPNPHAEGSPKAVRRARPTAAGAGASPDAGVDAAVAVDAASDARAGDAARVDGGRAGDLRSFGPEGTRVTAVLRVDRLRDAPDPARAIALTDRILQWLPDRHRLVDGSQLDLYRDFDALLIATPNPRDDAVTFVAVVHHVEEERLKSELSAAAATAGRPIVWQVQAGRPIGVRAIAQGLTPDRRATLARDDRLFVLPAPGLAVIASPAYANLLLGGAPDATDGGLPPTTAAGWQALAARLVAETEAVPAPAAVMLTASGLFSRTRAQQLTAREPGALRGLLPPRTLTITIAVDPSPTGAIDGEFESDAEAAAWARELPRLRQQFLGNPFVLLSGLTQLLASVEVARDDADAKIVHVKLRATWLDIERVIGLLQGLAGAR